MFTVLFLVCLLSELRLFWQTSSTEKKTNGYHSAHFSLSRATSRPLGMNMAIANYSNYVWAAANILMNLKTLPRPFTLLLSSTLQGLCHSAWIYRHFSLHPLLSMEFRDVCQNSISILTCFSHRESLVASLRALTGETFDKEDPPRMDELMDLQSDGPKHWRGWSYNCIQCITGISFHGAQSVLLKTEALISKRTEAEPDTVKSSILEGLSFPFNAASPPPTHRLLRALHPACCTAHQPLYGSLASGSGCYWIACLFPAVSYFKWFKHLQMNGLIDFQNDHYRSNSAQMLSFPKVLKIHFCSKAGATFNELQFRRDTSLLTWIWSRKHVWSVQMTSSLFSYNGYLVHFSEIRYREHHFSSS